jgi:hypothetical protein
MQKITNLFLVLLSAATFGYLRADLDGDGQVDLADLAILSEEWLRVDLPQDIEVVGELLPDAGGIYVYGGEYNGRPYYTRTDSEWFIWYLPEVESNVISAVLGGLLDTCYWQSDGDNLFGEYYPHNGAVGIAAVREAISGPEGTTLRLKGRWSVSWLWRPESSWREVHGVLPIAVLRFLDNSYLSVYYEATYNGETRTGGKFVMTDGTNAAEITANLGWNFADVVKFAVSCESGGAALYVETPVEGLLSVSDESIAFDNYLTSVQFSANANGEVKGLGAYGECCFWDSALAEVEIQKVFDFDSSAPVPTLQKTADQMLFTRDSIRCNHAMEQLEVNKPMQQNFPVAEQPKDFLLSEGTYSRIPLAVIGNKCFFIEGTQIKWTEDNHNFIALTNISVNPATAPSYSAGYTTLNSGALLDDGYLIVCLRKTADDTGRLFRVNPITGEAEQCTITGDDISNNTMFGYLADFGWTGVHGNKIVIGEYGDKTKVDGGKRVYLSEDYGKSFSLIYTRPKQAGQGMHIHLCVFHPTNPNIIYVSFGDSPYSNLIKLTKGETEWAAETTGLRVQPTAALACGNKLLFGNDGVLPFPTIFLFDPETNTAEAVLRFPLRSTTYPNAPYYTPERDTYCFSIKQLNGVYYASTYMSGGETCYSKGVYASLDGRNWTRLISELITSGFREIVGIDNQNRIWMSYVTSSNWGIYRLPVPKIKNIKFTFAERGITNELSEENSTFKTSKGNWFFSNSYDSSLSEWDSSVSLDKTGGALKVVGKYDGTNNRIQWRVQIPNINAGEFFNLRAYFKPIGIIEKPLKEGEYFQLPSLRLGLLQVPSSTFQYIHGYLSAYKDGWYIATAWGKAMETHSGGRINIFLNLYDFPTDRYGEVIIYMDCVQLIKNEDIQYSGTFQPGGTPRADEILIAPAY